MGRDLSTLLHTADLRNTEKTPSARQCCAAPTCAVQFPRCNLRGADFRGAHLEHLAERTKSADGACWSTPDLEKRDVWRGAAWCGSMGRAVAEAEVRLALLGKTAQIPAALGFFDGSAAAAQFYGSFGSECSIEWLSASIEFLKKELSRRSRSGLVRLKRWR